MLITVVIPSLGRDRRLLDTLGDLARQNYEPWECIVVLQGVPSPALLASMRQCLGSRLRMFHCDEPNASLARNIGLREARGDVVLFLDDDVQISDPLFLRNHAACFEDSTCPGATGPILAPGAKLRLTRHWLSRHRTAGWLFFPPNYGERTEVGNGTSANLSVRRDFAIEVGGMDANYEKGAHREETDFCLRLTKRFGPLRYEPSNALVHFGERTGGCRTWGHNSGIHPLHHVCGEWYFILKGLRLRTIPFTDVPLHIFVLLRRQVFNRSNLLQPSSVFRALAQSWRGLRKAMERLERGPRLICSLDSATYREL